MHLLLFFLLSFFLSYFATPLFRSLAVRLNILDIPNYRKVHKEPTPLLGGLAVYFGVIPILLLNLNDLYFFLGIMAAATVILIVGVLDDIKGLSVQSRLLVQFLSAGFVIALGGRISFLPVSFLKEPLEIILTLIWILGITNAFNCLDGIDGLAAGGAAISAAFFAFIAQQTGQTGISLISLALAGSCLGFAPHNFKPAKIFLGDGGSNFIGFILAGIALLGNWAEDNVVKLAIPVLVLAIPIFDMTFTTIMRIKEEKVKTIIGWLEYGGKDHFHHRLMDLGFSPVGAAIFICLAAVSFGLSAVIISRAGAQISILSVLQACIIFVGIAALVTAGKTILS